MPRRGSARPHAESGAQSLPPGNAERRRARAADAAAAAREFHLCQKDQPHRRQPGPAAPHGSRLAPAAGADRYARARLHHAHADSRKSRARAKFTSGHGGRLGARRTNCSIAACPREFALYLLPNAKAIRLVESGSLLHLLHKWTMRTCFNAQEEIYQASMEEVAQVRAAHAGAWALHRPAVLSCAPALPRRSAPKARTSAASKCGRSFPTSAPHMTRHGTLAYYLAAWVCGCTLHEHLHLAERSFRRAIDASLFHARRHRPAAFQFLALIFGAASAFLRRFRSAPHRTRRAVAVRLAVGSRGEPFFLRLLLELLRHLGPLLQLLLRIAPPLAPAAQYGRNNRPRRRHLAGSPRRRRNRLRPLSHPPCLRLLANQQTERRLPSRLHRARG